MLLPFLPQLEEYGAELKSGTHDDSEANTIAITSVHSLINYLKVNYSSTLARIENLISHGEITFDLLWAIFFPGTVLITPCPVTGEARAWMQMGVAERGKGSHGDYYELECFGVEHALVREDNTCVVNPHPPFGLGRARIHIPEFNGIKKISTLSATPMRYHPDQDSISQELVLRGRKWALFDGKHHVAYRGIATDIEGKKYSVRHFLR